MSLLLSEINPASYSVAKHEESADRWASADFTETDIEFSASLSKKEIVAKEFVNNGKKTMTYTLGLKLTPEEVGGVNNAMQILTSTLPQGWGTREPFKKGILYLKFKSTDGKTFEGDINGESLSPKKLKIKSSKVDFTGRVGFYYDNELKLAGLVFGFNVLDFHN